MIIRLIDFPDSQAKAMCIVDENGDYNVYINAKLSVEEQQDALIHEMIHIIRNDFECASVSEAERRTA